MHEARSRNTCDTDAATLERQRALIGQLSKPERLMRALALSALARSLAWAGAVRYAGERGHDAVVDRFLEQMYGPDVAAHLRRLIDRDAAAR